MSKNDRNIDFFEIWQKTSKKPQKNIKNLEKIAEKILANNTPFDSLNCACVQKKHHFFAFSQPKLIYWGIFEKNRDFDQKKTPLFPQKVQLITLFRKNAFPSYILEFCPLPTCKVWRNSILPFSRTWIIFFFSYLGIFSSWPARKPYPCLKDSQSRTATTT